MIYKPTDVNFEDYFPAGLTLETNRVLLRPLTLEDAASFFSITSSSPMLWKYFTKELHDHNQLLQWMHDAVDERLTGKRVPFTIVDKLSGAVCGSTSLGTISFHDKRIEIGWSWLGEQYLGSGVNVNAKFALLQYVFETMHFERVEIKTDSLNERAKQGLRKIGGIEEGVMRSHMLMPHGRRRDSIYFSILKNEWPEVKAVRFKEIGW